MVCQNCGAWQPDGSERCQNCGAVLDGGPALNAGDGTPEGNVKYFQKKLFASPVVLVATIALTLTCLLKIINVFSIPAAVYLGDAVYAVAIVSVLLVLIAMVPSLLICIGLWITYASAVGKGTSLKTGGLTTISVSLMIYRVLLYIYLGCSAVAVIMMMVEGFIVGYGAEKLLIALVALLCAIIIALVIALPLIFYTFASKTVRQMKNTARTGQPSESVSSFVAVMCFITAAISLSSTLFSYLYSRLLTQLAFGYLDISIPINMSSVGNVIASVCNSAFCIAVGIFLFQYRGKMKTLMPGYSAPAYQPQMNTNAGYQPQYNYAPQPQFQPQPESQQQSGTVPCISCGAQIPLGSKFCPVCGSGQEAPAQEARPSVRICPSCGSQVPEGSRFCQHCGAIMDN